MITVGGFFANCSRRVSPPRIVDELLVDDLDDLLGRVEGLRDLVAEGPLRSRAHERADDGQGHVGLEQGPPDLAHGGIDVGLGETALAAQVLEGGCEAVGQGAEHGGWGSSSSVDDPQRVSRPLPGGR